MDLAPDFIAATDVALAFGPGPAALRGVDLRVRQGEFVCLVGPSGCGKSTLLRLVAGLISPTTGSVTLGGVPAADAGRERRAGFVFQDPALLPWRNVRENVALPLELAGRSREESERRIAESLNLVGLPRSDWDKRPRALSGGMRMRVSVARALVQAPEVLLLDEPFAALDDLLRQQLNEELLRLWQLQHWTALFVTHNVSEAVFLGERIAVMGPAPGRVVAEFAVPFAHPRPPELRSEPEFARLAGEVSAALRASRA